VSGRGRWLRTLLLLAVAAVFLVPQLWLFSVSLKTKSGVFEYPPRLVGETASLANYRFVMERTQVPTYLWNSARVAALATLFTLLLGLPAAYVLSRERFRSRGPLLTAFLVIQTVSPIILLVPIYGVVARLGLLDTHAGLVIVYAAVQLPLTVVIMKAFFDAIPPSLFEAARLDGASRALTFRRVSLPLVGPGLAATAIFNIAA
jgi:multiple sugar transport system permease protein